MYVSDATNDRVISFRSNSPIGTLVAGTGVAGNRTWELKTPKGLYLDSMLNLYIADAYNYRVMRWAKNASFGIQVAGNGIQGNTLQTFTHPRDIAVDSTGNIFVCDVENHRVMKWTVNATSGIIVAGNGTEGNSFGQLNSPHDLLIDESTSTLYILDTGNDRIQRCTWNGSADCTTIFGMYGRGSNLQQLNQPLNFFRSNKTGNFYISDTNNHRVLKWKPGMRDAILMAGVTDVYGNASNLLRNPRSVITDLNETYMLIADYGNQRIQRYNLI